MTKDQILLPSTPASWIVARLREDELLGRLLGSGPAFPNLDADWGENGAMAPIYKAGEVPDWHPERFVVVRPPLRHDVDYYADLAPRTMDSTFLVWGETQLDKLPPDFDLDGVLEPIFHRLVAALSGVTIPDARGGRVLQASIVNAYTPLAVDVIEGVKVKQMGIQLLLTSTVASSE